MIDLNKLKELAEAAGGDSWTTDAEFCGATGTFEGRHVWRGDGDAVVRCFANIGHMPEPIDCFDVAEFVAAANPASVLELIALASAAAPQVVADERAAFEEFWTNPFHGDNSCIEWKADGYLSFLTREAYRAWCARAALQAAPVQSDTSDNAPWLTLAHIICADAGIPPGHISDRLKALRDKLEAPVQAQEPVAETYAHTMSNGRGRPDDPAPFETVCVRLLRNDLPADLKLYAAPVQPVVVPDGEEFGFKALRLRRTAFLLGLEGAIPYNDKDLMDCMGAVLGMICREVERIAAPAAQGDGEPDMFLRGVIAALGALAPHSQHGDVRHDEIVRSVGKEALYRTAEPEDVVWAGLDPEFYAAIAAKAVTP